MKDREKIIIYYHNYFLAKKYIELSEVFFYKKVNVDSLISRIKYFLVKQKLISFPIKLLLIFPIFFMKKNNSTKVVAFGIEDVYELFCVFKDSRSNNINIWIWNAHNNRYPFKIFLMVAKYLDCRLITFDPQEARNHGIEYHPQLYPIRSQASDIRKHVVSESKVFFYGLDKGRYNEILKIVSQLKQNGFSYDITVVRDVAKAYSSDDLLTSDTIDYDEYLARLRASSCLLDIGKVKQQGLTVRVIEALVLKKKIISNNINLSLFKFYHPHNIFILGKDDPSKLTSFLSEDFVEIATESLLEHDFDNFIRNL